jgi:uncharacterized protein (TIGR03435 family)
MWDRRALILLALAEIGIGASLALCQTPPPESFDAVAVKPWNMERVKFGVEVSGGRLEAGAVTLRDLIAEAYGVTDQGIAGTSGWMETERYNIHATAGRPATRSEFRMMLQNMLVDRFHLVIHHEPRHTKAYALVVDKGGPKLVPKDKPLHPAPPPPGQSQYLFGYTMGDLLRHLNTVGALQRIGRPVVDRTGLTGEYYIALTFEVQLAPDGQGTKMDIDYFSALKRELGLRLDPIEESFDQIVVESATKPALD